jgi:hypothetical protein
VQQQVSHKTTDHECLYLHLAGNLREDIENGIFEVFFQVCDRDIVKKRGSKAAKGGSEYFCKSMK